MMLNSKNLVPYIISSPAIFIVSCLVMAFVAIVQWKQIVLDDNSSFDILTSRIDIIAIMSFFTSVVMSFYMIKAVAKYRLTCIKFYCNVQAFYPRLKLDARNATGKILPDSFQSAQSTSAPIVTPVTASLKKQNRKKSHKKSLPLIPIPECKVAVPQPNTIQLSDLASGTLNCDSDWTVYKTRRSKRSSMPAISKNMTTTTSAKRRDSWEESITTNVTNNNKTKTTNLEKRYKMQIKSLLPIRQPLKNCGGENVPCLVGDNDSDSRASRLAITALPLHQKTSYYSPFSTGFDFSIPTLTMLPHNGGENYPSRLDEHLKCNDISSIDEISTFYPSSNIRASEILKLLSPSNDQVKTIITPTAFKYFDEMLISNSLYKNRKEDDLFLKNKKEWDNFAR
ncbi:hypothetical protein [Parasitella parasitica]|uniref:Uncharacterized protein n=1 Tax=Parasitella parasitica TaxID=35722 RepID=A0A0B7NBL0_9FUNG|nr:hypothetical protein [Parasitella parasitica]